METAEAVLHFLAGVGKNSETEFYLRLFRSRAPESFATIVVDSRTMREDAEGVALDLRLLGTLSLTPVVVLGFYDPARGEIETRKLQERLDAIGVSSEALSATSDKQAIAGAAARGAVPIVRLTGASEDARLVELSEMLARLATHKLIFLRSEGSLRLHEQPLSVVNLSDEFAALMAAPEMSAAHKALLTCSKKLVLELAHDELLVTITSPLNLLYELFTVKGAGTLLRRGARITRHAGLAGVDLAKLRELLTSSFGKAPREDVFARELTHVYVEDGYRGAALVAPSPLGAYLSKFAVTRQAQGEGLGRDLWQALIGDHRELLWRARPDNPIRSWYEKQCDGRVRANGWTVYFRGLPYEQIPAAVSFCLAQPTDF